MTPASVHPIYASALEIAEDLVRWRRHLHENPEPSMQEHETARYVADILDEKGIPFETGIGETGVVGLIGTGDGPTVALRADMDALEITEANDVPYASQRPGMMHACGHDAHTASLLGAATILADMELPGSVKLIFQPGEEGYAGARKMIRDGCLTDPDIKAIAGLHVTNEVVSGQVGIRRGFWTAQSDNIDMTIHGQSAHASRPDQGTDAISLAAGAQTAIQQFIARHTSAVDRKLLTFGTIEGGTRRNILADRVTLEGTIRSLEPRGRQAILDFLKDRLPAIVGAMGGEVKVTLHEGYPPLVNDDGVVDAIEDAALELFGAESVEQVPQPVLGAEDFAYYATEGGIPAAMCRLGVYDEEKGFTGGLHSTTFDLDDARVLPIGAALLAGTAVMMLQADYFGA